MVAGPIRIVAARSERLSPLRRAFIDSLDSNQVVTSTSSRGAFRYLAETLRRAGVTRNLWYLPACQSLYLAEHGPVVSFGTPLVTGTADDDRPHPGKFLIEFTELNGSILFAVEVRKQAEQSGPSNLSAPTNMPHCIINCARPKSLVTPRYWRSPGTSSW